MPLSVIKKRVFSSLFFVILIFTLSSCGGGGGESGNNNSTTKQEIKKAHIISADSANKGEVSLSWLASKQDSTIYPDIDYDIHFSKSGSDFIPQAK
jgi:hypothetical protein